MYEKTVSDISKSLRAMAKRVRRAEAQLSRRRGIPFGTTADREANEQSQLWWDTDLDALMANFGDGWEPVKDVRTGTTAQRTAYTGVNAGEFWWDTDEERLYAWDGHGWESTDSAESGTTVERNASSPENGQWWLDTDDGFTYVYDGIEWKAPTSSRYIEPYLLLASLYGLFAFVPYNKRNIPAVRLSNLIDYPGDVWHTTTYGEYNMTPYNSPEHGDNGCVPYLDFVAASSQYCSTKNYGTTGDLTILAWVSPDTASNTMPIVDKWYEGSDNRCYRLTLWSDNTFRFYVSDDGVTDTDYVATHALPSNELLGWNFVVARFNSGSSIDIFHNGAWTSVAGIPGAIPSSIHDYDDDIVFGKSNAASPVYFDGHMSIVAICKHAINNELIDHIYESTKASYIPQPEPQPSDSVSVGEYSYVSIIGGVAPQPHKKEYISVSESISIFDITNPSTDDSVSVSESVGLFDLTNPSTSDAVSVGESVDVSIATLDAITTSASDSISVAENIILDGISNITTSDSISVSEYDNVSITGALPSGINKVNYLLTDNEYFYANYWARTYPYWTTAWIEPSYLLTNNGYFSANYWPRRYKYWAIAP